MATLEKNVLMVKKERTDLILEYPITKMDNIVDMPDSFPPSPHTHDDRYFTETEMNAKLADKVGKIHTHAKADITDFPTSMPASDVSAWAKQASKPAYTKAEVGLANVTNDAQVKRAEMGVASGVATLDTAGKVPSSQLPSYVDDVLEYDTKAGFPSTGETGKIYVDKQSNLTYRWSGTAYVQISPSIALGETASTAYAGNKGKQATDNIDNILSGSTVVPRADFANRADLADRAQLALTASAVPWTSIESKPDTYPPSTHIHTKTDVGLANVTNDAQVKRAEMGVANGVATLDLTGKVPGAQLPIDPEYSYIYMGGAGSLSVHKFKDGRFEYFGTVSFSTIARECLIKHPFEVAYCDCFCTQKKRGLPTNFRPYLIGVCEMADALRIFIEDPYSGNSSLDPEPLISVHVIGYWKWPGT